jgi:hypothetical protein
MRGVRSCNFHRSSGFVFVKGMQGGEGDEQTFGLGETTVHSPSPRDPQQLRVDEFGTKAAGSFIERNIDILILTS